MGQSEVVDFLQKCEKPVTRLEIAESLQCDPIIVSHALRTLVKFKEVHFIEYSQDEASKLVGYVLLRRTRFFYLPKDQIQD